MARFADKEKARSMRAQGKTYSDIKQTLNISKSTLSGWLSDMPLSPEQMRQVRDLNPKRIERFRETMLAKREDRLKIALVEAHKDIGVLSRRELFIAGLYLYWGEGLKSARGTVGIANTDPAVIRTFLAWLDTIGISQTQIRIRLHLYNDMDAQEQIHFWSEELKIPKSQFRKPYVKESLLTGLTYKGGFGRGTCNATFASMPMWEYITMALKRLRELPFRP
jgi:hypothetical protein